MVTKIVETYIQRCWDCEWHRKYYEDGRIDKCLKEKGKEIEVNTTSAIPDWCPLKDAD